MDSRLSALISSWPKWTSEVDVDVASIVRTLIGRGGLLAVLSARQWTAVASQGIYAYLPSMPCLVFPIENRFVFLICNYRAFSQDIPCQDFESSESSRLN